LVLKKATKNKLKVPVPKNAYTNLQKRIHNFVQRPYSKPV
jgi:hypothetical protein